MKKTKYKKSRETVPLKGSLCAMLLGIFAKVSLGMRSGLDLPGLDSEESNPGVLVIQLVQRDEVGRRVLRLSCLYLGQRAPTGSKNTFKLIQPF